VTETLPPVGFSPEQQAALAYQGGNAYVAAGPGTGKTHLLVGRYVRLLDHEVAPERILVLTFSRRAADELRQRIDEALKAQGKATAAVEVRTFHGFASRLLQGDGARFRTRRLLDGFSRELLLDAAIAATPMATLSEETRSSRIFRTEAARLLDDVSRAPDPSLARITQEASARLSELLALRRIVIAARDRLGASDLNDLVSRAVQALADPSSEASLWLAAHRYEHVLVDEFQDTDAVQLALLGALGPVIFAVGDEAQSIYRFRGAQHGIVELAQARLAMHRFALTESRRCPPAVCELAAETPFVGGLAPRSSRADGAVVDVVAVRTTADEVHLVADRIEAALDAGTPAGEIAVLLRATRPFGPLLADELRRRAIPVIENSRDALLADSRIGTLRAAFAVLADPQAEAAWRRLLTATPLGYDPLAVRLNHAALRTFRPDAWLSAALDAAGLRSGFISNDAVATALTNAKAAWDAHDLGTAARRLARGLHLVAAVVREEPPAAVRAASSRLRTVCDGLTEAQRALAAIGRAATCAEIVALMDDHLAALAGDDGYAGADRSAVRISSVHGAKGLEFDFVVIADAVDGRFPQNSRASTLLSPADRTLLLDNGVDGASVTDAIDQEEASLWFVAVTRTKDRLLVTFAYEGLDGGEQRPSRFLTGRIPDGTTRVARDSLEIAALRDGDPLWRERLRAERRIAASPTLASYASDGDRAFLPLETRPFPVPERLSVGDAVEWLQCPRRVFYSRFVRLKSEGSTALTLGRALHLVLERFHKDATDFRSVTPGDVDRWTVALRALRREVWSEVDFEGAAIREACEIFADRVLGGYARALERRARAMPFTVEACERDVDVPMGPLHLRGRIDRLDRRASDGALLLVDYKAGTAKDKPFRTHLGKAAELWDAGESLAGTTDHQFTAQLAFYASALEHVGDFAYVYLKGAKKAREDVSVDATAYDDETRRLVDLMLADVRSHLAEPLADGRTLTLRTAQSSEACTFCNFREICPGPPEDNS
jgi:DNA helicase-2/ATP-dependent DNA helicase PcrA